MLQILRYVEKALNKEENISADIAALFHGDLNPVAPKAQKKVAVPEGLVATLAANYVTLVRGTMYSSTYGAWSNG